MGSSSKIRDVTKLRRGARRDRIPSFEKFRTFIFDPRQLFNFSTFFKFIKNNPIKERFVSGNLEEKLDKTFFSFSIDLERNMRSINIFKGVEEAVYLLRDFLKSEEIKSTFFVTGRIARTFPDMVKELSKDFELGYHGRRHENWGRIRWDMPMPLGFKEKMFYLDEDLRFFEEVLGGRPFSFRAPRLNSSSETVRLLESKGFKADSSYPSFLGGCREPFYFVSRKFWPKKNGSNILEIPVSAMNRPVLDRQRKVPYFKFPFLDSKTLTELDLKDFLCLCGETCKTFSLNEEKKNFLAMFTHQWEYKGKEDLEQLKEFFGELKDFGAQFLEVREVCNYNQN